MELNATIADIRRGDRFRWDGKTWLALDDARRNGEHAGHPIMNVAMIPAAGLKPGPDGVIDTGNALYSWPMVLAAAPVDILERGIPVTASSDEARPPQPDTAEHSQSSVMSHLAWIEASRTATGRALDELDETRDVRIRQALTLRVPVAKLTEVTGLSRARIYQIRDGRR